MNATRPTYEALDAKGLPYNRPARVVGELPHSDVRAALESATQEISRRLDMAAKGSIPFGSPVYVAFGLTRPQAKSHPEATLLLTHGENLPLDYCNECN